MVSSDVTIDGALILAEGDSEVDIRLLLCDEVSLTAAGVDSQQGTTEHYGKTTSLSIYGQSGGTGTLRSSGYIRCYEASAEGGYDAYAISCGIYVCGALKVYGGVVEATGRDLKDSAVDANSYGIYVSDMSVDNGSRVVAAGGDVSGVEASVSYGIYVEKNDLIVDDDSVITAVGGSADSSGDEARSTGIYVSYDMTVDEDSSVTAAAGSVTSGGGGYQACACGIYVFHDMYVEDGGAVVATGANASGAYYAKTSGIFVNGELSVESGGSMIVNGGDADAEHGDACAYGMYVRNELTVRDDEDDPSEPGGSIVVTGGSATTHAEGSCADAYGLYADDDMTISDGSAAAVDGSANAYGLYVYWDLDVGYDSIVTVTGGNAASRDGDAAACGVYIENYDMTVDSGSVVTVTGGDATASGTGDAWTFGIELEYGNDALYVEGYSTVMITGGDAEANVGKAYTHGLSADGSVYVGDYYDEYEDYDATSGSIVVTGGNASSNGDTAQAYGMYLYGGLTARRRSSVTATGGTAEAGTGAGESGGIGLYYLDVRDEAVVTGVSSAVTGTEEYTYSNGISTWGMSKVSGGTVVATGGTVNGSILADHSADLFATAQFVISGGTVKSGRDGGAVCVYYGNPDSMIVSGGSIQLCGDGDSMEYIKVENGVQLADLLAKGYAFYEADSEEGTAPIPLGNAGGQLIWAEVKPHTCTVTKGEDDTYACVCGRSYAKEPVAYLDANGSERYCGNYTVITAESSTALTSGWYVVKGDVELAKLPLGQDTDVHLILCDTAHLRVGRIDDVYGNNALTIYGQSTGDTMGKLSVNGGGIDCSGDLTINGGDIKVTNVRIDGAGYDAYAYGVYVSDELTVNGGCLTVDGVSAVTTDDYAYAYGIYLNDDMTVNGGCITVRNVSASNTIDAWVDVYGIYIDEDDYELTVNGGSITVEGISADTPGGAYVYVIENDDGDVIVNGGSITVNGAAFTSTGNIYHRGLDIDDNLIMWGGAITVNGAAVTSTAGRVKSYGILMGSDLTLTGGTITVNAGTATGLSAATCGIACDSLMQTKGTIYAAGDDITAQDETAQSESFGICAVSSGSTDGLLQVTGGSVTGIGGDIGGTASYGASYGIYTKNSNDEDNGLLSVNGGSVTGTGGSVGMENGRSCGIFADYMAVQSGTVTGTGDAEDDDIDVFWHFDLFAGTVRSGRSGGAVRVYADPLRVSGGSIRLADCYLDGVRALGGVKLADLPAPEQAYFAVKYVDNVEQEIGFVQLDGQTALRQVYVRACEHSYTNGTCAYCGGQQPVSDWDDDPSYSIRLAEAEHGSISLNFKRKYAWQGDTVTLNIAPDSGWVLETLTVTDRNGRELDVSVQGDKATFTMPASPVTVTAAFVEDLSMGDIFVDVPAGQYYYDAVLWAVKNGITGGIGEKRFGPDLGCTRAQLVTFLWRAAGSPAADHAMDFTDVDDVDANAYYG